MPSSNPRSKTHEPTIVDIEYGQTSLNASSQAIPEIQNSQTDTPELRESLEYIEDTPDGRTQRSYLWTALADRVPSPIANGARKAVAWIKGPQPPRKYHINPLFESIQTLPTRILFRLPKAGRVAVLPVAFALWVVLFGVILSNFSLPKNIGGFGAPVRLACVNRLWYGL